MNPVDELRSFLGAALVRPVTGGPAEEGGLVRRRVLASVTLVAGGLAMAWVVRMSPGDPRFYPATLLLAAIWLVGAFASGPMRAGRAHTRAGRQDGRAVVQSLALATLLIAVFVAGGLVVSQIPRLSDSAQELLDHAQYGPVLAAALVAVLNGVAEELYFRGALFSAIPARHAVAVTTLVYTLVVTLTGIPLLVLAAAVLGLTTALQRRVTGGVLGPIVTHVVWSLAMLLLLPTVLAIGG